MRKLTKAQEDQKETLIEALQKAHAELEEAFSEYNATVAKAAETVNEKIEAYNGVVSDAGSFVAEVGSTIREYYDNKSERWQEGDKGQVHDEWASEWENASLEQIEPIEPEEVETPGNDAHDTLEGLPIEAEG